MRGKDNKELKSLMARNLANHLKLDNLHKNYTNAPKAGTCIYKPFMRSQKNWIFIVLF